MLSERVGFGAPGDEADGIVRGKNPIKSFLRHGTRGKVERFQQLTVRDMKLARIGLHRPANHAGITGNCRGQVGGRTGERA